MTFRLPTESEWEYACRGNTGTRFYWGDDPDYTILNQYAWCSGNSSGSTQPVGALQVGSANPFGLFDLSGNVFEWCQDWYGPYIAQSQTDPGGAASGPGRVVRGGAWCFANTYCRTANRSYSGIDDHFSSIGFRVVLASN
jgi:formylglycine-generating enzyme required for sulfatase activity